MPKLKLKIATTERVLFDEEVDELIVPTKVGELTILPNHAALISEVVPGEMKIRNGKDEKIALIFGGFLHVEPGSKVIVLADEAEHLHEITEKEADEARKRAEESMKQAKEDKVMLAEAEAIFAKNMLRLKTIRKHRSHRGIGKLDQ